MSRFGFKEIDELNWLEADLVLRGFVRITPNGKSESLSGDDWVRAILRPKLNDEVPDDVQALFEVARGAMIYGFFFYPLYTLSAEQLYRVAEAAVHNKCMAMNARKIRRSFHNRVEWLNGNGIIKDSDLIRWDAIRKLRNAASHPNRQTIITPGNAIGTLESVTLSINELFNGE